MKKTLKCITILCLAMTFVQCGGAHKSSKYSTNSIRLIRSDAFKKSGINRILDEIVADMNDRSDETIIFSEDEGKGDREVKITFTHEPGNMLGRTECSFDSDSCSIVLNLDQKYIDYDDLPEKEKDESESLLDSVIRHELAHSFGRGHKNVTDDIMNFQPTDENKPALPLDKPDPNFETVNHKFIEDLNTFRKKGPSAELPDFSVK